MLRRVRLFRDGAGFVLRIIGIEFEEIERIPPSEGDHLLYARIKELGLTESADLLLNGEELVIPFRRRGTGGRCRTVCLPFASKAALFSAGRLGL